MSVPSVRFNTLQNESPRYNIKSAIVPCPGTEYVFLYGGFDENDNLDSKVYLLNTVTNSWEVDDAHPSLYREGHSAIYIGDGNIFVFGGVPFDDLPNGPSASPTTSFKNDAQMMVYSIFERRWLNAPSVFLHGAPSPRSRHACCLSEDGKSIFISGGLVNSTPLADLYTYDLGTGTWYGPVDYVARFDHSMAVYDGKLYTFGGLDADMNHVTDKITYMNLSDQSVVTVQMNRNSRRTELSRKNLQRFEFGPPLPRLDAGELHSLDHFDSQEENSHNEPDTPPRLLEPIANKFEYIWIDSGDPQIKLEVALPSWGSQSAYSRTFASQVNLESFSKSQLLSVQEVSNHLQSSGEVDISNYVWRHAFVFDSSVHLLGELGDEFEPHNSTPGALCALLSVKLASLGLNPASKTSKSVSDDICALFLNEEHTDFEVFAFRSQESKDMYGSKTLGSNSEFLEDLAFVNKHLSSIKVHKAILIARWPHFRRMIESDMLETKSNQLFVPETHQSMWMLIFYLYAGSIDFPKMQTTVFTPADYSASLVLSNLYELSEYRTHLLVVLFRLIDSLESKLSEIFGARDTGGIVLELLKVWENVLISNEDLLTLRLKNLIRKYWTVVTRSAAFADLPKTKIIRLCQECFDNGNEGQNSWSNRNSLCSTDSVGFTPSQNFDKAQSNSPFMKNFDDDALSSPRGRPDFVSSMSIHFPDLKNVSDEH